MYHIKTICNFCHKLQTLLIDPKMPNKEPRYFECQDCQGFVAEMFEETKEENLQELV